MALPNNLSNGTVADADKVMANFNYVLIRPKIYQASIPSQLITTDASYTTKQTIDLNANKAFSMEYQLNISINVSSSTTYWRLHLTMSDNSTADIGEVTCNSDASTHSGFAMITGCYQPTEGLTIKKIEIQGKRTSGSQSGLLNADNYFIQTQTPDNGVVSWIRYLAE